MRTFKASLGFALSGFAHMVRTQRNFRIQVAFGSFVLLAGAYFHITLVEWMFLISAIFRVLSHEAINTSVEELANVCETKKDLDIKNVKDTAASYVLLSVFYSIAIGILIFGERILGVFW